MDLISRNFDDGPINLVDSRVLSDETYQKDNLHLGKSIKSDDREYFMKSMGKMTKDFTTEYFGKYFQNHHFQFKHI